MENSKLPCFCFVCGGYALHEMDLDTLRAWDGGTVRVRYTVLKGSAWIAWRSPPAKRYAGCEPTEDEP